MTEGLSVEIREERPEDHPVVHELQSRAFGQAAEADLVDALRRDAEPRLSLVACSAGVAVGHVFFSPLQLENTEEAPALAGLAPVGVEPELQGKGIGSQLIRAGLLVARSMGWAAVFLVGNPAYYGRFGFQLGAARGFTYGDPHFDPVLQYLELEPGALTGLRGRVLFHPAFAATGTG